MGKRIKAFLVVIAVLVIAFAAVPFVSHTEAASVQGKWVLTETNIYTPKNYTSRQNEYYKYVDSVKVNKKGMVTFKVSGGYKGPGDWFTCTMTHKCSKPKSSYAPGEKATLTISVSQSNVVNNCGANGQSMAKLRQENKDLPNDGRSKFFMNGLGDTNVYTNFRNDSWRTYVQAGETKKLFAYMPSEAEKGDRCAIVVFNDSSYDSYGTDYEDQYGGHQAYEWIYTFKTVPSKGVVSSIKNQTGAKAKVTVKKVSGATNYQIKYKVSGSSKWYSANGNSNVFSIKVGKGKTVTVKARVKNKIGWGSFGKTKSFKTDKK